jgi:hypothetical protein
MTQFTTYPHTLMTEYTLQRRTEQLIAEVKVHPHRDELLKLIQEQRIDSLMDEYVTLIN